MVSSDETVSSDDTDRDVFSILENDEINDLFFVMCRSRFLSNGQNTVEMVKIDMDCGDEDPLEHFKKNRRRLLSKSSYANIPPSMTIQPFSEFCVMINGQVRSFKRSANPRILYCKTVNMDNDRINRRCSICRFGRKTRLQYTPEEIMTVDCTHCTSKLTMDRAYQCSSCCTVYLYSAIF